MLNASSYTMKSFNIEIIYSCQMLNASSYTMKCFNIELAIGPFLSCKFIPTIKIFVK